MDSLDEAMHAASRMDLLAHDFPRGRRSTAALAQSRLFRSNGQPLRSVLRTAQGRHGQPSAFILDGRTLQSTCEGGITA
jgi:hypothetical protein